MRIQITKSAYANLKSELSPLKGELETGGYYSWDSREIDLAKIARPVIEKTIANLAKKKGKQARSIQSELTSWLAVLDAKDTGALRAKTLREFTLLATKWIGDIPRRWLYHGAHPWFVTQVKYHPPERHRHGTTPAYCELKLARYRLGADETSVLNIYAGDARAPIAEVFASLGYVAATDTLNAEYDADHARWYALQARVGLRVVVNAPAVAVYRSEEAEKEAREYSWRRASKEQIVDGSCVIDVISESGTSVSKQNDITTAFWEAWEGSLSDVRDEDDEDEDEDVVDEGAPQRSGAYDEEDEDEDGDEGDSDAIRSGYDPRVPAPSCFSFMVFDLLRHGRYEVQLSEVEVYEYRTDLTSKLVLPEDDLGLIDLLVAGDADGDFTDIVEGKSSGAVVLCTGIPGTGKTLTAQVFSESTKRPLYSIQCSQLGVYPDELEASLLQAFARAQRWNAVLLLDEADVYVRQRGDDVDQNAIVGVFLRVLEWFPGVLFLTTNRADLVDDAIASRCVARIDYGLPSGELLLRIWRTLAANASVPISEATIQAAVTEWPLVSGRDVLQMLKLARKVARRRGLAEVTIEVLRFVRRYKPTNNYGSKQRAPVTA